MNPQNGIIWGIEKNETWNTHLPVHPTKVTAEQWPADVPNGRVSLLTEVSNRANLCFWLTFCNSKAPSYITF